MLNKNTKEDGFEENMIREQEMKGSAGDIYICNMVFIYLFIFDKF